MLKNKITRRKCYGNILLFLFKCEILQRTTRYYSTFTVATCMASFLIVIEWNESLFKPQWITFQENHFQNIYWKTWHVCNVIMICSCMMFAVKSVRLSCSHMLPSFHCTLLWWKTEFLKHHTTTYHYHVTNMSSL
jgi:hypothetical protein